MQQTDEALDRLAAVLDRLNALVSSAARVADTVQSAAGPAIEAAQYEAARAVRILQEIRES